MFLLPVINLLGKNYLIQLNAESRNSIQSVQVKTELTVMYACLILKAKVQLISLISFKNGEHGAAAYILLSALFGGDCPVPEIRRDRLDF